MKMCARSMMSVKLESGHENRWSGPKELENLKPIADHDTRFAGQMGTAGLGTNKSNPYIANPTTEERRSKITETFVAQDEEFVRHASCLARLPSAAQRAHR